MEDIIFVFQICTLVLFYLPATIKTDDYFAQQVGISEVRAELLLEEKVQSIEKLQAENHKVCMIGDGVNDAPALKTADVSVAMGSMGSDIAVDAAEVGLMRKLRISH